MGMMLNITLFWFIFAFLLWMVGYPPLVVGMVACFNQNVVQNQSGLSQYSQQYMSPNSQYSFCNISILGVQVPMQIIDLALLGIIVAGVVGGAFVSFVFPNYVSMFAAVAILFYGLITFPVVLIDQIPGISAEIRLFVGGLFVISMTFAIISWYKGTET